MGHSGYRRAGLTGLGADWNSPEVVVTISWCRNSRKILLSQEGRRYKLDISYCNLSFQFSELLLRNHCLMLPALAKGRNRTCHSAIGHGFSR
jgi:hypothetical protein